MIHKIICPTDFSKSAQNAIDYAIKLSKLHNAELLLVNVQQIVPIAFAVSLDVNPEAPVIEKSRAASVALRELTEHIRNTYDIDCNYEVDLTGKTVADTISDAADKNALFVMGTDGADGVMEELFGSHTFKVIRKTENPLLLVPVQCRFNDIKRIIYVSTSPSGEKLPLQHLKDITDVFRAELTFIDTEDLTTFEARKKEIQDFYGAESEKITFWNRQTDDVVNLINEFMDQERFDLLIMEETDRNLIQAIFKADPVKKISAQAEYPVLVLHSITED